MFLSQVFHYIYICEYYHIVYHIVHPPVSAGGIEAPTKFSENGAWQDLNFERELLERRR